MLYFDKKNKNNKYAIFYIFFTNLPTLLLLFFSLRQIIMLTTKCKTNLILDKTNKINKFCADYIFICYLSLFQ